MSFLKIARASSSRPFSTNQRGVSGMTVSVSTKSTDGITAPQPSIARHATPGRRSRKQNVATKPKRIPTLMEISLQLTSDPRNSFGATSAM